MAAKTKKSEVKINVSLDENKIPSEITWEASDSGVKGEQPCRSVMVSIWDHTDRSTLRIDLWTKDMEVDDMKQFFYETFVTMADSYERSCADETGGAEIRKFAKHFATKIDLIKKK